jgi:nucleotide-binding universal stress UspA family protein
MLSCQVPTLVFNPHCPPPPQIRHIVFPTDFSKESLLAFDAVLGFAAQLRARVSVVNYFHHPMLSIFLQGASQSQFEVDLKHKEFLSRNDGAKLEKIGLGKKVKTKFHLLTDRGAFNPSGGLLKFAQSQKADLIALAAQSGEFKATLIGATSRELARSAKCPVLIYRS